MALRGQRFELDLDADEFTAIPLPHVEVHEAGQCFSIGEIRERSPTGVPAPPKFKPSKTGFPEHKKRQDYLRGFKQTAPLKSQASSSGNVSLKGDTTPVAIPSQLPPSDAAIAHHVSQKYGYDPEARQKAEISDENKKRIAAMSTQDIEEARAELMSNLNPALIERLLRRAKLEDSEDLDRHGAGSDGTEQPQLAKFNAATPTDDEPASQLEPRSHTLAPETASQSVDSASVHFPVPPRPASSFIPLDPDDPNFLNDLKTHYFPDIPHDPSTLSWLQDPSAEENAESEYNPAKESYTASSVRFSFTGKLIPPKVSLTIDASKGLHHHGIAPSSAGYTIPELAILSRSTLPNQRCIAYQVLGRILYRLGKGDFGPRGSELQEGLWTVIEHEKAIDIMMREANRDGGHVSAKAYATEALWLWRKGGGGDRGLLKEKEKRAQ